MVEKAPSAPRCAVIVDPYLSGKISLLETLQLNCSVIHGHGMVKDGNTVDDAVPEVRASHMSTKILIGNGENWAKGGHFWIVPGRIKIVRNPELHG